MGLDHLDMTFRLEKAFGFKWESTDNADFKRLWNMRTNKDIQDDCTVGDVHAFVCARLRELGRPVPPSSWHRVQHAMAKVVTVPIRQIRPESFLKRDLGFQ